MRYKNQELLNKITSYIGETLTGEGRIPSNREVGDYFGISKSCAQKYMSTISKQGLCKQLNKYRDDCSKAKIIDANASCGTPTYEEENILEYIRLPIPLFGKDEKIIIHASGDSMMDAGINDGDVLFISPQADAKDGDIVAATINGASTLKTYMHHKDGRPYLHPENSQYDDIEIHEGDDFYIQGVLIYVLKNYRGFKSNLIFKENLE